MEQPRETPLQLRPGRLMADALRDLLRPPLAVLLLLYTLWIWYAYYRARRVRDLDDLAANL